MIARRLPTWAGGRAAHAGARLRASSWSIAQMAAGAGVAWQLSSSFLGHQYPFFAAVAAVVCLGLGADHRVRRVAELAVGVTVGVALGEVVVQLIGRGSWQITLVVGLALAVARFLDSGSLVATQAALQAVLVIAIPQTTSGALARWLDALVGGSVALAVALLTPADPRRGPDAAARAALPRLGDLLMATAWAVRARDADAAGRALSDARRTQGALDAWESDVLTAEEVVRLSPLRRHQASAVAGRRRAFTGIDRAIRNTRVLVRRVAVALDDDRPVPESLADHLDALADALGQVDGAVGERPQPRLVEAVTAVGRRLDVAGPDAAEWWSSAMVAQLRSVVVDVLTATGMPVREARRLLPAP